MTDFWVLITRFGKDVEGSGSYLLQALSQRLTRNVSHSSRSVA